MVDTDTWGEVINGPNTVRTIVDGLKTGWPVVIGWTDGRASHHDVLFTVVKDIHGHLQGIHPTAQSIPSTILFVSVMRIGAFGFVMEHDATFVVRYVAEKLGVGGATAEALAALMNDVVKELV
jgi:hypothetical protein